MKHRWCKRRLFLKKLKIEVQLLTSSDKIALCFGILFWFSQNRLIEWFFIKISMSLELGFTKKVGRRLERWSDRNNDI